MSKKLKILHTMTWLAPGGGVDREVYLLIDDLKDEYDFHFAVGHDIHENHFNEIKGLPVFICPYLERTLKPWKDFKSLFYFYRLIKREKYDIVHTHETKASLISRVAAWMAGCPRIIYGLHGVAFNDPLSKARRKIYILLEKMTLWMCDSIVSVSENALQIYHDNGLAKNINSIVAYSGIDTDLFLKSKPSAEVRDAKRKELGFSKEDMVIVNVGRFSYSKAQRYTIECFAKLKKTHPALKLLLVGDGELAPDCKKQATDLGVEKDIVFYGYSKDVPSLLYISDIMMLTSLREGLPRVVVEACLVGIPTVSFEVEGIREIIRPECHEYIVPQTDVDALVTVTARLLDSKDRREQFVKACHDHAVKNWNYKEMTSRVKELYDRT